MVEPGKKPRLVYSTNKREILRQVKAGGKDLQWVLDTLLRAGTRVERLKILREWSQVIAEVYEVPVDEVRGTARRRGWI